MTQPRKKKPLAFEQSLEQLEKIVTKMESGELSLEEALAHYEQGIRLTRECQLALTEAEQRVKMLVEKDGKITDVAFNIPNLPSENQGQ
jgi:exodeoxyribonuclease VII small subunit